MFVFVASCAGEFEVPFGRSRQVVNRKRSE